MIKQICIWWNSMIAARRLRRALPKVVERRDTTLPVLRRQHKTTRHVIAENYREMHEALGVRRKG
jgi:hypothetical protein